MPAAAAREPSAAWDPTDTRPCSSAGRVLTRAPCCGNFPVPVTTCDRRIPFPCHRHVPGSLSPARTGRFPSCAYSQALRGCKACVAALQDRGLSGAIGHPGIVGRGNICSSFGHSSDIRRACLPPFACAVSRILDRTPRPPERNSLPPAWLRARALRWLFDHGNASNYLLVCCSIVMHPRYRSLMKIIQLRCERY